MDTRLGRFVLAGCLFISWAICISVRYLIPAVMMAGKNADVKQFYKIYYGLAGGSLSVIAYIQLIAAILIVFSVYTYSSRSKGVADENADYKKT